MNQQQMYNGEMQYAPIEIPKTPENPPLQLDGEAQSLNRGRIKPHVTNLYTAVLNKAKRETSLSNSPSVGKIQNQYFSNVSTPKSSTDPRPVSTMSPLSKFGRNESNADLYPEENSATIPFTDDMVENFKLEDHKGNVVNFAKTYHGSR